MYFADEPEHITQLRQSLRRFMPSPQLFPQLRRLTAKNEAFCVDRYNYTVSGMMPLWHVSSPRGAMQRGLPPSTGDAAL
jgi:hypothetical protein